MIVRWGLRELPLLLRELEIERPFLSRASAGGSSTFLRRRGGARSPPIASRCPPGWTASWPLWALLAARAISRWLPQVVDRPRDAGRRRALLEGAMLAGQALAASFMGLGHAIAQAIGGRYGLPHGALNAISLPAALRFNEPVAADAIERFGRAMGTENAVARVEELARLGGFDRLRDVGVPAEDLDELAADVSTGTRPAPGRIRVRRHPPTWPSCFAPSGEGQRARVRRSRGQPPSGQVGKGCLIVLLSSFDPSVRH